MKRTFVRLIACLVFVLLIPIACLAANTDPANETGRRIAIVLPADDGYESLVSENNMDITELMNIYIAAAEKMGNKILLQGPTNNNNPSGWKYRTDDGLAINWSNAPKKGNEATLHSTIGSLNRNEYDNYDVIIVITGHMGNTIQNQLKRINTACPTYLIQLVPFEDGTDLLSRYCTIAGLSSPNQGSKDSNSFISYTAARNDTGAGSELHYKLYGEVSAEQVLTDLLTETLFDGFISIHPDTFSLPATLVDELYMFIQGKQVADIRLVSPDGTRYSVTTDSSIQGDVLPSRDLSYSGQKARLISLRDIMSSGEWQIENTPSSTSVKLFYTQKQNASALIQGAQLIDPQLEQTVLKKGTEIFKVVPGDTIRDLYALYPSLRLRVTDTINNAWSGENTATEDQPDQVSMSFTTGGEHTLSFRLVNGEDEILKQTVHIKIEDNAPVFNRQESEEIVVYPDTLTSNAWHQSVEGWFSDPDGDTITVTKTGGDTRRITFADNTLTLHLDDNILDGSEDVILKANSDTQETSGTVRIVWRSLAPQLNSIRVPVTLEPVTEGEPFAKRTKVRIRAKVNYDGPDEARILDELQNCEAYIADENGERIAKVSFVDQNKEFLSDVFELPDKSGNYLWKLCLNSEEGRQPMWTIEKKTDRISIENAAPIADSEMLSDDNFGEQYFFHVSDWSFKVPADLITDPDNDPVSYHITVKGDQPAEPVVFNTVNDIQPITLPGFGDYRITIQGFDNENVQTGEIVKEVSLIDLAQTLEGIEGKYSVDPEQDQYQKRSNITLILKLKTNEWSDRAKEAITRWLNNCGKEVQQDNETMPGKTPKYDPEQQAFTVDIQVPEKGKDYRYRIVLKSKENEQPEVVNENAANPFELKVSNEQPVFTEELDLGNTDSWVMNAEEYNDIVIPKGIFTDLDNDEIHYSLKLLKIHNKDEEIIEDGDITLPHTLQFKPFGFFELSNHYKAVITASDNDAKENSETIDITLHNQKLLYMIIGAAILLLLIIIAIIVYIIHRKNLPKFSGSISFVLNDQPVSPDINLKPWEKQKHLPLSIFAGSIDILLTNPQWDALKQLEVRPDKKDGYKLYKMKSSSKKEEEIPYDLGDGLTIRKK